MLSKTIKPRAKPRNLESGIQRAFVKWCAYNLKRYPRLDMAYAVPNGGARNAVTGAILKAEGVRKGVPDWCLPVRGKDGYSGLYIEFKTEKGVIRTEQWDYIVMLRAEGYQAEVCRSCEEAVNFVKGYLGE